LLLTYWTKDRRRKTGKEEVENVFVLFAVQKIPTQHKKDSYPGIKVTKNAGGTVQPKSLQQIVFSSQI